MLEERNYDKIVEKKIGKLNVRFGHYRALPCEMAIEINGHYTSRYDFLEMNREPDDTGYGCSSVDYERIHPRTVKERLRNDEIRDEITTDDIIDIQDYLLENLHYGSCGWCI